MPNMSFPRCSQSQSLGLVWKNYTKHNKRTHSPIKRNALQHKINTKKTKARFSRLLRHLAWKRRGSILISALHKFVTYLLRYHLPTYLQLQDPRRASQRVIFPSRGQCWVPFCALTLLAEWQTKIQDHKTLCHLPVGSVPEVEAWETV